MPDLLCPSCGYVWQYQGHSNYASCPKCHRKLNVAKNTIQMVYRAYLTTPEADFRINAFKKSGDDTIELRINKVTDGEIKTKTLKLKLEQELLNWLNTYLKIINLF